MKIAYLSKSQVPSSAASSVNVMKMCSAFATQGHSVNLFTDMNPDTTANPFDYYDVEPNFQIAELGLGIKNRNALSKLYSKWRINKEIKRIAPDLIYARYAKGLEVTAKLGIPFAFEVHMLPDNRRRHEKLLRKTNFAKLVVISQSLRDEYLSNFPFLDPTKVIVAHDGADSPRNVFPKQDSDSFRVGYVGQLYPGKGMEIISQLPLRCPYAEFHVVGGDADKVTQWKNQLGLAANITFHGFVPHSETASHLASFDVVLAPYQSKTEARGGADITRWMSPLKIFEYMSHGKAIIASDLPVLREVLQNDRNALLVPSGDADAWAAAIARLHNNSTIRTRIGTQAKRDFEEKYTWLSRAKHILANLGHNN